MSVFLERNSAQYRLDPISRQHAVQLVVRRRIVPSDATELAQLLKTAKKFFGQTTLTDELESLVRWRLFDVFF